MDAALYRLMVAEEAKPCIWSVPIPAHSRRLPNQVVINAVGLIYLSFASTSCVAAYYPSVDNSSQTL